MNEEYDFTLYKNIEDLKYYSVFIRPDGTMYRIWKFDHPLYEGENYVSHSEWASVFLEANPQLNEKYEELRDYYGTTYSKYDFLVHHLRFVAYTRTPNPWNIECGYFAVLPALESGSTFFDFRYTDPQIDCIRKLKKLNNDEISPVLTNLLERRSYDLWHEMIAEICQEEKERD